MSESTSLRISITGDLALGGPFLEKHRPRGQPLTYPFEALKEAFRSTDILIVNLEGPLTTEGPPRPGRTALLHNDPAVLDWLGSFPQAVCCLANNHMSDYGADALLHTRDTLTRHGIHTVGAGANAAEASRPLLIERRGLKVGILAFTTDELHVGSVIAGDTSPGASALPAPDETAARVRRLREQADIAIVLIHDGFEYHRLPTPARVELTRTLVDAGASVVIGHHPHVQQGVEVHDGAVICHSLGNFLLPEMMATTGRVQYRKPYTKQFAMLQVDTSGPDLAEWTLIAGLCDRRYRLRPYGPTEQTRFDRDLAVWSAPLGLPNYSAHWQEYRKKRRTELRNEGRWDALAKLIRHPQHLLRTLTLRDVTRSIRRLCGVTS